MATLSLCMIVRNEGPTLDRAISSFSGLADEVVIVDTGSTDDTVAVAESFGAKVLHHEWQDSFSVARNLGFDACTGDWVFALDADEYLLPESRDELKRLVETGTSTGYVITRRDITPGGTSEMFFVRLGRRSAGRRLVGRIHEHFEPPLDRIEKSGILIEHTGYSPGRKEPRLRRNVRLLEMELADRPGQSYYLADLTHTYWLLRDPRWKEALVQTLASLDLSLPKSPVPVVPALLEMVFSAPESELPAGVTHAAAETIAERWYPTAVPLLVSRCRLAFGRGDLPAAADLGERAIKAWESGRYDRTISFNPISVGPEMRLNLGIALAHSGRIEEAIHRFEEAEQDPRFTEAAKANIAALRALD
ncbi:glycosyltransferase [bacterium]|nr:MAG: glycosyltransferase [bacterium]